MAGLSDKQKRFVDEYLIDLNATRAYKAAYKSIKSDDAARANGSRLLANANVQEYLSKRQNDLQDRLEITQDMIVNELAKAGFANITDFVEIKNGIVKIKNTTEIPKDKIGAIAGIEDGNFGIKLKLNDKLRALETIAKILGFDKPNESNSNDEAAHNELIQAIKKVAKHED